ncbi:MAG: histidine phosphatase family protein [Pseudomonadota bacterium]
MTASGRIHMARHGRPDIDRSTPMAARDYDAFWAQYQETGLVAGEKPSEDLAKIAEEAGALASSSLRRARETMAALAGDRGWLIDDVFVEAALPAPPLPLLRLSPKIWGAISRVWLWCGESHCQEIRPDEENRAQRAGDILIDLAAEGSDVLLCGHGWFNRMTGRVLRERGWVCVHDGGDAYWSWRTYAPGAQAIASPGSPVEALSKTP